MSRLSLLFLLSFFFSINLKLSAQSIVPVEEINKAMEVQNIAHTYLNMEDYFRTKTLTKSSQPYEFPKKENIQLPESFSYGDKTFDSRDYLDSSYVQGFLVIQNDTLVYEDYWRGQSVDSKHISWSVSKSFTSALIGIALKEGHIKSLNETVDSYAPILKGSGYDGIKIEDVLEMSSGVGFDETYSDPESDISRWWAGFTQGDSQDEFAASLQRELEPGTFNRYISINTHVLGMVLVAATGKSVTEYMQEKLWEPLGMEDDAYWLIDKKGMEMVLGGLNATARDYAKLGQLYLHKGKFGGEQLVPADWIEKSVNPNKEHLLPGSENSSSPAFGYGYQWWIPDGDEGEMMAIGVYNQYIYINPTTQTVIVKNSANQNYNDSSNPHGSSIVHLDLFREIAKMN